MEDWSRASAHNTAGVSSEIAVTAELLDAALIGGLPVARATPEGSDNYRGRVPMRTPGGVGCVPTLAG